MSRSLTTRISSLLSSATVVSAGVFILMACRVDGGSGCGTIPIDDTVPIEPPACEVGFHEEEDCSSDCPPGVVCDASLDCELQCVPDPVCPEGTVEEYVCEAPATMVDCDGSEDCTIPEPPCFLQCVPVEVCPAGMHEEEVCWYYDGAEGAPDCVEGEDCGGGGGCELQCVPDAVCPEGQHEEQICWEEPVDCAPGEDCVGGGGCELTCVPDDVCPPGTEPQTMCTYCEESECWTECVPVGEPKPEPLPREDAPRSR